jgi:hypothetical protein
VTETRDKDLQSIGACALASIREMVAALECDYDRLEELRDDRDDLTAELPPAEDAETTDGQTALANLAEWTRDNGDELAALEAAAGECGSRDDAEQRIHEDPLSIEYRSGWVTDKTEMVAEEVKILLTTGGPAVQIIVELDDGQPRRAYLQVQDWGTPWTDYYKDGIGDVLMAYVRCFCFE